MSRQERNEYPDIVPFLVLPFEKDCEHAGHLYAALVFAQRSRNILFAAEAACRFGVGVLDATGRIRQSTHYSTLDAALRAFLAAPMAADA